MVAGRGLSVNIAQIITIRFSTCWTMILWVVGCREKLDWLPLYSLREGVERTTNWYLDGFGRRDAATIERLLMEQTDERRARHHRRCLAGP